MKKELREFAELVGQALARRWITKGQQSQHTGDSSRNADDPARAGADHVERTQTSASDERGQSHPRNESP
jgi:hypothetical protein